MLDNIPSLWLQDGKLGLILYDDYFLSLMQKISVWQYSRDYMSLLW